MSTTYSANAGLGTPAHGDANYDTVLDANRALLDTIAGVGPLCVQATEHPSTTLNVKVAAGPYRKSDNTVGNYAGTSSQAMTTASTNFVYILESSGVLTVSTSAYPTTVPIVKLATVVAGATAITSVTDNRVAFLSTYTTLPTPTIAAGAGAGTSPTISITGTDTEGYITLLTGTSPGATGTVATISFGSTRAAAPKSVVIGPGSVNAGGLDIAATPADYSTTQWLLKVGSAALTGTTTYIFTYIVR